MFFFFLQKRLILITKLVKGVELLHTQCLVIIATFFTTKSHHSTVHYIILQQTTSLWSSWKRLILSLNIELLHGLVNMQQIKHVHDVLLLSSWWSWTTYTLMFYEQLTNKGPKLSSSSSKIVLSIHPCSCFK